MARITKTQITQATNELIEAVGVMLSASPGHWDMLRPEHVEAVQSKFDALIDLQDEREHAAPATHRNTSIAAGKLIEPMVGSIRRQLICIIAAQYRRGFVGCTDEALEIRTQRPHSTVSAARNHLFNIGWIKPSGEYRQTATKRDAIVWTLTDKALDQLPELLEGVSHGPPENQSA